MHCGSYVCMPARGRAGVLTVCSRVLVDHSTSISMMLSSLRRLKELTELVLSDNTLEVCWWTGLQPGNISN